MGTFLFDCLLYVGFSYYVDIYGIFRSGFIAFGYPGWPVSFGLILVVFKVLV